MSVGRGHHHSCSPKGRDAGSHSFQVSLTWLFDVRLPGHHHHHVQNILAPGPHSIQVSLTWLLDVRLPGHHIYMYKKSLGCARMRSSGLKTCIRSRVSCVFLRTLEKHVSSYFDSRMHRRRSGGPPLFRCPLSMSLRGLSIFRHWGITHFRKQLELPHKPSKEKLSRSAEAPHRLSGRVI